MARTEQPDKQVLVNGKRSDGRTLEEFRPAFLNAGTQSKATGSAYAEFGSTKVIVGVYGPRETDRRQGFSQGGLLQVDIKRLGFSAASKASSKQAGSDSDRGDAQVLQQALESVVQLDAFPKAVVDIFCVVLEAGGSDLSILITAASLALADAGIPMLDLVSSCYISRVSGQLLLDPAQTEIDRQDGGCLLAMMVQQNKVTHFAVTGEWTISQLTSVMELGMGACMQLDATVRQNLLTPAE